MNLETTTTTVDSSAFIIPSIIGLVFTVLFIAAMWKIFTKAGQAGWKAIIPIYNLVVLMRIVGRPGWWVILLLIPGLNIIFGIILALDVAKSYGKSTIFAVFGLIIFNYIGYLMLGFGSATYQGPAAQRA